MLTALGKTVVERARALLRDVEDLVALCQASAEPFTGNLRIGVIPTIAPFMLPGLLKALRREHPQFTPFIREDQSQPLIDALHRGELDILLLALPFAAEGVDTMSLFSDRFLLAAPPTHPLAQRAQLKTADLKGRDLLLLEDGHCLREHALEACKLRDSDVMLPYQATSLTTVVQMVASGIGVTLIPEMAARADLIPGNEVALVPFAGGDVAREIGLMWRRKTPRHTEFRLLGDFIASYQQDAQAAALD